MKRIVAPYPLRPLLYALGIIAVGLLGRATIDKLLTTQGGAESVALWAQTQSVVEMVVGVVSIGIGQGVTVLIAQQSDPDRHRVISRTALILGTALATMVALILLILIGNNIIHTWLPIGTLQGVLAVLVGALGVAAAVQNAAWLGQNRQDRVFWLSGGMLLFPVVAALVGLSLTGLLAAQALCAVLVTGAVIVALRNHKTNSPLNNSRWRDWIKRFSAAGEDRALIAYVPVGLAIGLASPIALILVRGEVSNALSWRDAGLIQSIWRSSEWVTATMSGLLAYLVLPRLSAAIPAGHDAFQRTLNHSAVRILVPTAILLFLLWFNQRAVIAMLYDRSFVLPDHIVGLFFTGELLRVASWVILFALLAMRATIWVTVGEFLSLPLFAALILLFADGMSLDRAAMLYLVTYAIYLAFNLIGLRRVCSQLSQLEKGQEPS